MGKPRIARWFEAANNERLDLIHEKYSGEGLTFEQETRLSALEAKVDAEVSRVYSLPFDKLEEGRRMLDALKDEDGHPPTAREADGAKVKR